MCGASGLFPSHEDTEHFHFATSGQCHLGVGIAVDVGGPSIYNAVVEGMNPDGGHGDNQAVLTGCPTS